VTDTQCQRRNALGLRRLDHVEEAVGSKLQAIGDFYAQLRHRLFVVVKLHRPGLERQPIGLALVAPGLFGPQLDRCPIEPGEVEEEAVLHVLDLIGFGVKDVGRLSGAQGRLEAGRERGLLIPGLLELYPRVLGFELFDGLLDECPLGHFCRPMAPEGQLLRLGTHGKAGDPNGGADSDRKHLGAHGTPSSVVERPYVRVRPRCNNPVAFEVELGTRAFLRQRDCQQSWQGPARSISCRVPKLHPESTLRSLAAPLALSVRGAPETSDSTAYCGAAAASAELASNHI